jgi:hypothetical protein
MCHTVYVSYVDFSDAVRSPRKVCSTSDICTQHLSSSTVAVRLAWQQHWQNIVHLKTFQDHKCTQILARLRNELPLCQDCHFVEWRFERRCTSSKMPESCPSPDSRRARKTGDMPCR